MYKWLKDDHKKKSFILVGDNIDKRARLSLIIIIIWIAPNIIIIIALYILRYNDKSDQTC